MCINLNSIWLIAKTMLPRSLIRSVLSGWTYKWYWTMSILSKETNDRPALNQLSPGNIYDKICWSDSFAFDSKNLCPQQEVVCATVVHIGMGPTSYRIRYVQLRRALTGIIWIVWIWNSSYPHSIRSKEFKTTFKSFTGVLSWEIQHRTTP